MKYNDEQIVRSLGFTPVDQPDEVYVIDGVLMIIGCFLVVGIFLLAMWGLKWAFGV